MLAEITTREPRLLAELRRAADDPGKLPNGILIGTPEVREGSELFAIGVPEVISFALGAASSTAINIASSWLWETIKGRASKLRIEGRDVKLSLEDIHRACELYISTQSRSAVANTVEQRPENLKDSGSGSK
jgi:hypothetical protein